MSEAKQALPRCKNGSSLLQALSRFCLCLIVAAVVSPSAAGPLSERIAFIAPLNGINKIYFCKPDGRDLQRLGRQKGHQLEVMYSKPLERFFYARPDRDRRFEICSVDKNGDDFRLEIDRVSNSRYPDVSPDGTTLLFCTDMWGAFELAELNFASRKITRLTYDQSINTAPRFSPDGKSILFLSRRQGYSELFVMDTESQTVRQIIDTPFPKSAGRWHPDGDRVICTEARPPRSYPVLLEIDLKTSSSRYLLSTEKNIHSPVYSVDGNEILFTQNQQLHTFDPSDTAAVPFPLKGALLPSEPIWTEYPLP